MHDDDEAKLKNQKQWELVEQKGRNIVKIFYLYIKQARTKELHNRKFSPNSRNRGTVIDLLPERIASNSVCRPEDHIHALLRLRY